MTEDPIERQLKERLNDLVTASGPGRMVLLGGSYACECAVLRRLCLRACQECLQTDELFEKLKAAAEGKEVGDDED